MIHSTIFDLGQDLRLVELVSDWMVASVHRVSYIHSVVPEVVAVVKQEDKLEVAFDTHWVDTVPADTAVWRLLASGLAYIQVVEDPYGCASCVVGEGQDVRDSSVDEVAIEVEASVSSSFPW